MKERKFERFIESAQLTHQLQISNPNSPISIESALVQLKSFDFRQSPLSPDYNGSQDLIAITSPLNPQQRFDIIGGLTGILSLILRNRTRPNIKTFTLVRVSSPDGMSGALHSCSVVNPVDIQVFLRCLI